jgi:hypothetical protein
MAIADTQTDEASLAQRLEIQKRLVDRLIREGKDATEANAKLYELSKALSIHDDPSQAQPRVQTR